jgi:hypothetical protein
LHPKRGGCAGWCSLLPGAPQHYTRARLNAAPCASFAQHTPLQCEEALAPCLRREDAQPPLRREEPQPPLRCEEALAPRLRRMHMVPVRQGWRIAAQVRSGCAVCKPCCTGLGTMPARSRNQLASGRIAHNRPAVVEHITPPPQAMFPGMSRLANRRATTALLSRASTCHERPGATPNLVPKHMVAGVSRSPVP